MFNTSPTKQRTHLFMIAGLITGLLFLSACGGSSSNASGNSEIPQKEPTALEQALTSGDASLVDDSRVFISAALNYIESNDQVYHRDIQQLLNLNDDGSVKDNAESLTDITWDITHDAAQIQSLFGFNTPLLFSNATQNDESEVVRPLAVIGSEALGDGISRYMVFGGNPMRNLKRGHDISDDMQSLMLNSLEWLSQRNDFDVRSLNVVISQLDQSYYFPDESATREWLDDQLPGQVTYNVENACDSGMLLNCINDETDLIIISQYGLTDETEIDTLIGQIAAAQQLNIGILYLHRDGDLTGLGQAIFNQLNVRYVRDNYWQKVLIKNANPADKVFQLNDEVLKIKSLLTTLENSNVSFDWSECDEEDCSRVEHYQQQFEDGADQARYLLQRLDTNNINVFASLYKESYLLEKYLILLADSLRQNVTYPMDKVTTPDIEFLSAQYADYAQYISRLVNSTQADLGNFSRSDFSSVPRIDKEVEIISKSNFRSAGIYAIPGETVKITRLDTETVTTKVTVNTIRDGATHWFAKDGYKRPRYLQSASIEIKPNEPIVFTSSIGGPLHIYFSANDVTTRFKFENVGQHPYWAGIQDNEKFVTQLAEDLFDWAEVVTPGFEVHSKTDKMKESIERWDSAAELAQATERYMHNFPHVLAGFQGPGIDVEPEIHNFANDHDLTIQTIDQVKHMNADQATCGYGCSGNPYDAYWAFSPIGHGDVHELGHGLEKSRFRFAGWKVHSTTNPYSYFTKYNYYLDTGNDPSCQSLPFKALFDILKASQRQENPDEYMQEQGLTEWNQNAAMMIQMMMAGQAQGSLTNGWFLLARLHILEREFYTATRNDENWNSMKDDLGFANYTRDAANEMTNNDWMNISLSVALQKDMREFLSMWGLSANPVANEQVAGLSLPKMEKVFYAADGADFCTGLNKSAIPVSQTMAWPTE